MAYPPLHESGSQLASALTLEEFGEHFPRESEFVEFKQGLPESKIGEAATAFSNSAGGVVLLGVDNNGDPVGLNVGGETEAKVHRAVRAVRDGGRYVLQTLSVDGRAVLALSVYRRREGFAQLQDGRVLVRRGAMNVPLLGAELTRFLSERALVRFESTESSIHLSESDPALLDHLARAYGWEGDASDRLAEIGLATHASRPLLTVAGALYLRPRPAEVLGKSYVEVFRYREASTWDRREQVDGPLDEQVRQTVRLIVSELGSDLVILGVRRHDLPRLPEPVLREAVANAVAHRSYEISAQPVTVEIRPDRVTIRSPGGLPEPVTLANIRGQSAARNVDTIKVLRQLKLAEDAGLGIDVMQDTMAESMLEPPEFASDGTYVAVTLRLGSAVKPQERAWLAEIERGGRITPGDRLLLVHAARGLVLTNTTVRSLTGLDSTHARAAMARLRELGYLTQRGTRGGSTYVLADTLGPPPGLELGLEELREVVFALVAERDRVTNEDVRQRTGLDRSKALSLLGSMVDLGLLRRNGERRGTYYTAVEPQ